MQKITHLKNTLAFIKKFDSFITEQTWNERFDVPMMQYLEQIGDPNLKIFMEITTPNENQNLLSTQSLHQNKTEGVVNSNRTGA